MIIPAGSKINIDWVKWFYSLVSEFYGVSTPFEFRNLEEGTLGQYRPDTDKVLLDASLMRGTANKLARVIVHELTHSWQVHAFRHASYACLSNGRYEETYWNAGHFLEESARRSSKGYDMRPAFEALAKDAAFVEALQKGENSALKEAENKFNLVCQLENEMPGFKLPEVIRKEMR